MSAPPPAAPAVNAQVVEELLAALAGFSSGGRGVTRLAYSAAWCSAQRWLAAEAEQRGLRPVVDWAGNLLFFPPSVGGTGEWAVMVGSHLDSVVDGGRYDGAYGAVAGMLLAAAAVDGRGPRRGVRHAEEEGIRFRERSWGRALCSAASSRSSPTGCATGTGLPGARGSRPPGPQGARAGSELSPRLIRRRSCSSSRGAGPVLEAAGDDLGIVEAVAGYRDSRRD